MSKRRANGEGSIYKHEKGFWVGRYSYHGTRKAIYGKTQAEVRKKLREIATKIDADEFIEDEDITVEQWMDIWQNDYLGNVKPGTVANYEMHNRLYITPEIGSIKLCDLKAPQIQKMYNKLIRKGLSPKSVKNTHGCLHRALDIAVKVGYLSKNVTEACILPRVEQSEIEPLDTPDVVALMKVLNTAEYGALFKTALFTGMRSGELLGLTWDCVDFENGVIYVKKQLIQPRHKGDKPYWGTLKNDKPRTILPAPYVMEVLKEHKEHQKQQELAAGSAWNPGKFPNLVFTHPDGSHLSQPTLWKQFQKVLSDAGLGHHRFHDLRHSYSVISLQAGDDMKTLQMNLGHHTAAFTMQRYAHATATMNRASANRMQDFITNCENISREG